MLQLSDIEVYQNLQDKILVPTHIFEKMPLPETQLNSLVD